MQFNQSNDSIEKQIVTLSGALNADRMEDIRPLFDVMATSAAEEVVVDLTHVNKIDASGVGAIVFLFKRLKGANRHLKISGVHGQPEAIIRLLRLDKSIDTNFLS